MKKINLNEAMEAFEKVGAKLNPEFLKRENVVSPVLEQVAILLDAVGEGGLKLTQKGNLPTKVVKELAFCHPTPSELKYLKFTKRFIEDEQMTAIRIRVLCEHCKLVRKVKGKLLPGSMVQAYANSSEPEQFIYLFHRFLSINLGYFDRMQEFGLINHISFLMLQFLRDKQPLFRDMKAYAVLLFDEYPQIADDVEETLLPESYLAEDPFDEFERLMKVRLFQHFYLPFGFVEEQGVKMDETYACRKTALTDLFLLPVNAIDEQQVLDRKLFRKFSQRNEDEGLGIDLFHDFCFLYTGFAGYPLPPSEMMADTLVKQKRLIGTAAKQQKSFYTDFADAIAQTLRQYTQKDTKGSRDDLQAGFSRLVDALYDLLRKTTPFNLFQDLQPITFFLFDMLRVTYKLDVASADFFDRCRERFDEEVAEDIGGLIYKMGEFHKLAKKQKKMKARTQQLAKEVIIAYLLAIMSIHVHEMDKG